jgi:hypothetical protein
MISGNRIRDLEIGITLFGLGRKNGTQFYLLFVGKLKKKPAGEYYYFVYQYLRVATYMIYY